MGERPDEVRRHPDPFAEDRASDPATDAFEPGAVNRDPAALGDEVEVSRVEIERTRANMSETVDAIQGRLSPENLKEQAKERVREATMGRVQEASSGIVGTIRENPLPAALAGIGLGWLFMSGRKQRAEQTRLRRRPYPDYDYPPRYEERGTSGPSTGQALERARDRVGETASQAQDRAGQVASQAQDRAGQVVSQAQDRASRLGDQARYQARRASGGFQRMLRENPLSVGALAVGLGAGVGLAIPETAKEHEVMGEARDNLVEKAQEKAQDAQQKIQSVAQEAQSAAQQEAQNQGLTDQ